MTRPATCPSVPAYAPIRPPPVGWHQRFRDGTPVLLRLIGPDDAHRELEFLRGLSREMRGLRFLGLVKEPDIDVARELTNRDAAHPVGFVATVSREGRERQIGAARFRADRDRSCGCSVTVSNAWRRRGVVMRLLIAAARVRGIRHMRPLAPPGADGSQHLAARLGFQRRPEAQDPAAVVYRLDL